MSIRANTCQIRGRRFTKMKEKPGSGEGGDWQRSKQPPDQIMCGQKYGLKMVKAAQNREKTGMGKRKAEARQCSKTERNLFYWSRWQRILRNSQKMQGENWKDLWLPRCRVKWQAQASWKRAQSRRLAMKRSSKQCMIVLWNLMNLRDNEQNFCSLWETTRITLQVKGFTSMTHTIWCTSLFRCHKRWKFRMQKGCRGQGMEKARDNSSMGVGESQEQEGGYSGSTKRQKESPLCYTDGHMSPQKMRKLEPKLQKYRGRVVLRGDIVVKDDSGAYAVFTEQARLRHRWLLQK